MENRCVWLVIYLNCTMMHGLTSLKFKKSGFFHSILCQHPVICCEFNDFKVIFRYFEFVEQLFRLL